jgi:hypothetical protein
MQRSVGKNGKGGGQNLFGEAEHVEVMLAEGKNPR